VGLHRPSTDDPLFRMLPASRASQAYSAILDGIIGYLREMEAPTPVVDVMIATGSAEITWLSESDHGLKRAPSIAEWIDASCGSFTEQEADRVLRLRDPFFANKLSPDETLLYRTLRQKQDKKIVCESTLIYNENDRLTPP
jgi:hypothetical protein